MSKNSETQGKAADTQTAPYIAFKSFQTAIDKLHEGMPHVIDKTVWPSFSFGTIAQILSAFKFLGLIDDKAVPQQDLRNLADLKEADRKPAIRKLIEKRYPAVMAVDLTKATPAQLEDAMKTYNVNGATLRKAVTFFLQAAQFSMLPMSQYLQAKTKRGVTVGTRRRRVNKPNGGTAEPLADTTTSSSTSGTSRVIALISGGTLTLSVELDLLRLSGPDRRFVFELIDKLEEYEGKNKTETASERTL